MFTEYLLNDHLALIHRPPIRQEWDEPLKDLLHHMLKKDPAERIVMSDLRVCLRIKLFEVGLTGTGTPLGD